MSNENYQYAPMLDNSLMVTGNQVQQPAHPVSRDKGDGVHADVADGASQERGITRIQHNPEQERRELAVSGVDVMQTLKANARPGESLDPRRATILWQGYEMPLAAAAKLNLVREDGPGRWVSTSVAGAAATSQTAPQAAPKVAAQGDHTETPPPPLHSHTVAQIEALEQEPAPAGLQRNRGEDDQRGGDHLGQHRARLQHAAPCEGDCRADRPRSSTASHRMAATAGHRRAGVPRLLRDLVSPRVSARQCGSSSRPATRRISVRSSRSSSREPCRPPLRSMPRGCKPVSARAAMRKPTSPAWAGSVLHHSHGLV